MHWGLLVPGIGLDASFAHIAPKPGKLAFVAQSGAVVTSVIDWATTRGIGFSHLVSLGDMADVDFGDMLDYLANDSATSAILLYIESITQARKFMSAGRAAARMKPVILVKAGRHAEGARAAASHTGALAGSDEVYDAAFRRAGMLRVLHLEELFDAVETLAMVAPPTGDRLAILTNGGGAGVMATDALIDEGGHLAALSASTMAALNEVLPATWSRANPVDIIGDATAERYGAALDVVMKDPNVDGVLVISCPTAMLSPTDAAKAVVRVVDGRRHPIVFTSWLGDSAAQEAHHDFAEHGIPTYDTPDDAVQAFMHMAQYRANQETLRETPSSLAEELTPDTEAAQALIAQVLAEGRSWMTEPESKALLVAYDIPVATTMTATTPEEAATVAADLGGAVALKIVAPDITHKSDVGGVALNLLGPKQVLDSAKAMLKRVRQAKPGATVTGFSVQTMIHRPGAHELILGMFNDRQFGPMLLFGQGGVAVEEIDDKALSLPPLNMRLAREMMARTRIHRLLQGYRDHALANLDAIAATLIKLSQLVIDIAEIEEMDINPLLVDEYGVVALDAWVKLQRMARSGTERLAIRPYPKELEETVRLKDGRELLLRPVLPEDEPTLRAMVKTLTPEETRLRFFAPVKELTHMMAARFTQLDYDREMALILVESGIPGRSEIFAVVRISTDPDNERAEYAIIVRHDLTDQGLGQMLMERIIAYSRKRGIKEIVGDVLRENSVMLKLCASLGFRHSVVEDEPTTVHVSLAL